MIDCSGVYIITNLVNNKVYIGSSYDVYNRLNNHIYALIGNYHINKYLQRAWNKYGEQNFDLDILEFCEKEKCLKREQFYFDTKLFAQEYIKSNKRDNRFRKLSYNINPVAGNSTGREFLPETLQKMSNKMKEFWAKNPHKIMRGENHPFFGKPAYNKGIKGAVIECKRIKVVRITKDLSDYKIYNKCEDVQEDGYSRTIVRKCCNGKQPIYRDHFWMYYNDFVNDEIAADFLDNAYKNIEIFRQSPRLKRIEILKKDKDGNLLEVIDPVKLATKERRVLHLACQGKIQRDGSNRYKGYYYEYKSML